jgi:hypothetical protein
MKKHTALDRQIFAKKAVAKAVDAYIKKYGNTPETSEQLRYALEGAASTNRKELDDSKRRLRAVRPGWA